MLTEWRMLITMTHFPLCIIYLFLWGSWSTLKHIYLPFTAELKLRFCKLISFSGNSVSHF